MIEKTSAGADRCSEEGRSVCFERVHAHVPLPFLFKNRSFFTDDGINPEIYLNHSSLKRFSRSDLSALADDLSRSGLSVSIHAPFLDLSPGAIDPAFRSLTVQRLKSALTAAAHFQPRSVVFHPGYDPLRFAEHRDTWLKNSLRTWNEVKGIAADMPGTLFLLENIFETEPSTLSDLLDLLPSPPFGFCFDTGHYQVFSTVPLTAWFKKLGHRLKEIHLHDNDGSGDSHLPPGRGTFPFDTLFGLLPSLDGPVIGTLEAHSEPDLRAGLAFLDSRGLRP